MDAGTIAAFIPGGTEASSQSMSQRVEENDMNDEAALHQGAPGGDEKECTRLLSTGATADDQDECVMTPLMQASSRGHVGVVQELLHDIGVQGLADRDNKGWAALDYAVDRGHEDVVSLLLSRGAKANRVSHANTTTLMRACNRGHLGIVTMLLQHVLGRGKGQDHGGETPLLHALWRGLLGVAQMITQVVWGPPRVGASDGGHKRTVESALECMLRERLEKRDPRGHTALYHAAAAGHRDVVALLLRVGAQPDRPSWTGTTALMTACSLEHVGVASLLVRHMRREGRGLEGKDVRGWTALYHAAAAGQVEVLCLLLGNGAQPGCLNYAGMTPLMHAAWRGHVGVVRKLVPVLGRRELAQREGRGRTALHLAADAGHEGVVALLLVDRAQAYMKDEQGMTPLMHASRGGHMRVVQQLAQAVRWQGLLEEDEDGRTALHHAVNAGQEEVLTFLLSIGAPANRKDRTGVTPLMGASTEGHQGTVRMLLQDVGVKGLYDMAADGRTALHFACSQGRAGVVRTLLVAGADTTIMDKEGKTARTLAEDKGHSEVVAVFKQWWEVDPEWRYLLTRARKLHDMDPQDATGASVPAYLKARQSAGLALPRVEVMRMQQEQHGGGGVTQVSDSAKAGGTEEREEEQHAVLEYVLKGSDRKLFRQLINTFHPRRER